MSPGTAGDCATGSPAAQPAAANATTATATSVLARVGDARDDLAAFAVHDCVLLRVADVADHDVGEVRGDGLAGGGSGRVGARRGYGGGTGDGIGDGIGDGGDGGLGLGSGPGPGPGSGDSGR